MSADHVLIPVRALLGAFDSLWHHELTERLPRGAPELWCAAS